MEVDGGRGGGRRRHDHNGGRGGRGNRYRAYRQHGGNNGPFPVEDQHPSDRERFLKLLFDLGKGPLAKEGVSEDQQLAMAEQHTSEHLAGAVHVMRTTAAEDQTMVVDSFLHCVVNLGHRSTHYATLLGMLNYQAPEVAEAVIAAVGQQLQAAVRGEGGDVPGQGPDANQKFALLLRFYAALVPVNAVLCSSLIALFANVVAAAASVAEAGGPDWRCWQPYADFLVCAVVLALPWCGSTVSETHLEELQQLLSDIDAYVAARPCQVSRIWMPYDEEEGEDDMTGLRDSDSGAASFLARAWAAVKECRDAGWEVHSIQKPHLAMSKHQYMGALEHDVPALDVPPRPPSIPSDAPPGVVAARMIALYPPRGGMRLIAPETSLPTESSDIERVVAEEYLLQVIHSFAANREACVVQVTARLHLPFPYDWIVCELLFAQMLRLPHTQLRPYAYQSVLLGLTEVIPRIARGFGGCMKAIFQNIGHMDPALVRRVADLLAYHLSNAFWQWPWARWERVLTAGPLDPQRRFCCTVVGLLIRLSFAGHVKKLLPAGWEELMPSHDVAQAPPKGDDGAAVGPPYDDMQRWIKEKLPAPAMLTHLQKLASDGAGAATTLRQFTHALLFAAQKTPFHTITLIERYKATFSAMCAQVDESGAAGDGEAVLVESASLTWGSNGLRLSLTVDRFVAEGLLRAPAILRWALSATPVGTVRIIADDCHAADAAYDVLHKAISATVQKAEGVGSAIKKAESTLLEGRARQAKLEEDLIAVQKESQDASKTGIARDEIMHRIRNLEQAEAAVTAQVAEAQQAVSQLQADATGSEDMLSDTLLLAFKLFLQGLVDLDRKVGDEGQTEEQEDKEANCIRRRMLCSHLLSFNRSYCQHTLPLMPAVDALCDELGVQDDVRALALLK